MKRYSKKIKTLADCTLWRYLCLFVIGVSFLAAGCSTTQISLTPTPEVHETFKKVDIDPGKYAFFTSGPESAPEAILLIGNDYMGDFNSSGWKLRDKKTIMNLLKAISEKGSTAKTFGFPVVGEDGVEKGKLFTTFRVGKMFLDKEDGSFLVATPEMLDIGKGAYKRTSCSISVCQ